MPTRNSLLFKVYITFALVAFLSITSPKALAQSTSNEFIQNGIRYQIIPNATSPEVTVTGGASDNSEIVIPESVTFNGTTFTVTSIGDNAFKGGWLEDSSLTSVTLPNTIKSIGNEAFAWCYSLKSINFGNGIETIGGSTFHHCINLASITLPSGIKTIGGGAFKGCSSLKTAYLGKSLTEISDEMLAYCYSLTTVEIPDKVTRIGEGAFWECRSINKINIPESLEEFDNYAFFMCSALTDIKIPESTHRIGLYAFSQCNSLGSVYIPNVETWGACAFSDCASLYKVEFGDNVKTTGEDCFEKCRNLYSVKLGKNMETVSYASFNKCNKLTNVIFNEKLTTIEDFAFGRCNLTSLTLPNSVRTIGRYAFFVNSYLKEVELGHNIETIGENAFQECYKITSFTVHGENPPVCGPNALIDIDKANCTLNIPHAAIEKYQNADQWKDFININSLDGVQDFVIDAANGNIELYNLHGIPVGTSTENLPSGIYIIRRTGKTQKIRL